MDSAGIAAAGFDSRSARESPLKDGTDTLSNA